MGRGGTWGPFYKPPQAERADLSTAVRGMKRVRGCVLRTALSSAEDLEGEALYFISWLPVGSRGSL